MYYTIQNNNLLTANNAQALTQYYDNVKPLPSDYELGKYIVQDGELVLNPDYETEQAKKEAERVSKLTCTKRVFALMLQELGITYTMLKQLIATNELAQLEWDLCVELERGNPLLDIMAYPLGITSEQLDGLFKYANGEITLEQFREIGEKPEYEPIEDTEKPEEFVTSDDIAEEV